MYPGTNSSPLFAGYFRVPQVGTAAAKAYNMNLGKWLFALSTKDTKNILERMKKMKEAWSKIKQDIKALREKTRSIAHAV